MALALGVRQGEGARTGYPTHSAKRLRAHRVRQAEQWLAAANVWEDGGFVFCQANGRPIDARRDWKEWKSLLQAAGVRDARLHDARHTAATLLLQQGCLPGWRWRSLVTRRSA